jgi:hypothetical protein
MMSMAERDKNEPKGYGHGHGAGYDEHKADKHWGNWYKCCLLSSTSFLHHHNTTTSQLQQAPSSRQLSLSTPNHKNIHHAFLQVIQAIFVRCCLSLADAPHIHARTAPCFTPEVDPAAGTRVPHVQDNGRRRRQ